MLKIQPKSNGTINVIFARIRFCLVLIATCFCAQVFAATENDKQVEDMRDEIRGLIFYGKNYPKGWKQAIHGAPYKIMQEQLFAECPQCSGNALAVLSRDGWTAILSVGSERHRLGEQVLERHLILDAFFVKSRLLNKRTRIETMCEQSGMGNEEMFRVRRESIVAIVTNPDIRKSHWLLPREVYVLEHQFGSFRRLAEEKRTLVRCFVTENIGH